MPKEVIRSTIWPDDPKDAPYGRQHVEVIWSNFSSGFVQVGSMRADARRANMVDDALIFTVVPSGNYVSLDRDGINQLIRVLRRARDKNFGPDA